MCLIYELVPGIFHLKTRIYSLYKMLQNNRLFFEFFLFFLFSFFLWFFFCCFFFFCVCVTFPDWLFPQSSRFKTSTVHHIKIISDPYLTIFTANTPPYTLVTITSLALSLPCVGSKMVLVGRLVGWVLWHINLCRLFNAKSIFTQIVSSISNNSVLHDYTV